MCLIETHDKGYTIKDIQEGENIVCPDNTVNIQKKNGNIFLRLLKGKFSPSN